jgi:hypothetical protein
MRPTFGKTDILVTAYCLKCFDMATIEGEFQDGVFQRLIPTGHITQVGKGKNKVLRCRCGGEVKLLMPNVSSSKNAG